MMALVLVMNQAIVKKSNERVGWTILGAPNCTCEVNRMINVSTACMRDGRRKESSDSEGQLCDFCGGILLRERTCSGEVNTSRTL